MEMNSELFQLHAWKNSKLMKWIQLELYTTCPKLALLDEGILGHMCLSVTVWGNEAIFHYSKVLLIYLFEVF